MMRVIVCGSRTWTNRDAIWDRLDKLPRPVTIVHGGARGVDTFAESWARTMRYAAACGALALAQSGFVEIECHSADWKQHGRRAGPIRNSEMAARGADLCIAFRMPGKSNGTDDMVKKARAAGIPVEVVTG